MNELLAAMLTITPVTIGGTEAVKRAAGNWIDVNRFAPIIAILVGIAVAFAFPPAAGARDEVAAGVLSGLAAAGLWSGFKTTAMGK